MALAKEVERNVRRKENWQFPPDSDSGKRRAMKAAVAVADESRMDVEGEERDGSRSSTEPNIRRRIVTTTSTEESGMDDGGQEGDGFRGSTAPTTRRRSVTKTPLEENRPDERTVAVTTQESLDGTCEKAMRIASPGEMRASSSARRGLSPEGAEIDKTKKAIEILTALVGSITK